MATGPCTDYACCHYNSGWKEYGSALGYAGYNGNTGKNTCFIFRFKTPASYSGTAWNTVTALSGQIKIRRAGQSTNKGRGSGQVLLKIFTSDPKGGSFPDFSGGAILSWSRSAAGWENFSYTFPASSLAPGTTYYLGVGPYSGNLAEISLADFTANVTYTAVDKNTVSAPVITNHDNGTFSISASAGVTGSGNYITSTTLSYKRIGVDGAFHSTDVSGLSLSSQSLGAGGNTAEVLVKAQVDVVGGNNTSANAELTIRNYLAPTAPSSVPVLADSSLKNGRLTIKKNWTYTWGASNKQGFSDVLGYSIEIHKKSVTDPDFSRITGLTYSGDTISKGTGNNTFVNKQNTSCSLTFDPVNLGFVPGDKIKVHIWGYCKNGKDEILYSNAVNSEERTVQNAGVVKVKVDNNNDSNSWREGVVWIKVNNNNDNTSWKEADTVQVKISDSGDNCWKESE